MAREISGLGREMAEPVAETRSLVAGDGVSLAYRFFPARAENVRASVVYLHGIQSHGGWYVHTAAELARRGYSVYLLDRRGSGVSGGRKGFFSGWDQLIDDVRKFVDLARRDSPARPTFLIGGCWGARPAVAFALRGERELAGLALVCPAIKVRVDLPLRDKLKVVVGHVLFPEWPVRIPLTPEMFTSNPSYVEFVRTDPLSLSHVTARFFFETLRSSRFLAQPPSLALPMLLMQAGSDPIVDVPAVQRWFDGMASSARKSVLYPSFGHILDFEQERQRYWDDLVAWLDETVGETPLEQPDEERPVP